MRKLLAGMCLSVGLGMVASQVYALDWTVAVGHSGDSSMVYRLGLQWDPAKRWWQSETGHLGVYWDLGYTYWDAKKGPSVHALSLAPVFFYEFNGERVRPYIELGIGVSAFSQTRVEENKLSTSFQFEDRLGVGLRFGEQELGLRMLHYSNARLKRPNDGIESYSVHYRTSF